MWLAQCWLHRALYTVAQSIDGYAAINKKITAAILVVQTVGMAGYQTNTSYFSLVSISFLMLQQNLMPSNVL